MGIFIEKSSRGNFKQFILVMDPPLKNWWYRTEKEAVPFKGPFLPSNNLWLMHELWATITHVHKSLQSSTFYPRVPDMSTWPWYQVKYVSGEQIAWRYKCTTENACLRAYRIIQWRIWDFWPIFPKRTAWKNCAVVLQDTRDYILVFV